jgi:hypothetical protein
MNVIMHAIILHTCIEKKIFKSLFLLQQGPEVRLPLGQGIAGHVASTGKAVVGHMASIIGQS